jgi:hypothetical protein
LLTQRHRVPANMAVFLFIPAFESVQNRTFYTFNRSTVAGIDIVMHR